MTEPHRDTCDVLVVGGGIHGAGIAHDQAGRDLRCRRSGRPGPGEGSAEASACS